MVKVLFLIPNLAHGGAERVLTNLVNHMDYAKFDVTVQTMFDVGIYQKQLNKEVRYIPGFPWYFRGNTWVYKMFSPKFLYKRYIKAKYDIIVSYLEGPSTRVVSGCDDNTKLVTWIHIQFDTKEYATLAFRNMNEVKECYQKFNRIICVSENVRESFNQVIQNNVPKQVLYNTVETEVIRERSKELIDDIQFSKDIINLISVAKLMKSKGYDRLVRVHKRLKEEGLKCHVYIVGIGEEKDALEKLIKENHLEDAWTFLGFRDNPYKYVRNADLYVCSSRKEGFSTAVTEALLVGTPVVSTNCSGANELLGYHDEYGIVTDNSEEGLYQGLKKMLSQPDLLSHYKQKVIERGEQFSMSKTVKAVEDMLKEVVSE